MFLGDKNRDSGQVMRARAGDQKEKHSSPKWLKKRNGSKRERGGGGGSGRTVLLELRKRQLSDVRDK